MLTTVEVVHEIVGGCWGRTVTVKLHVLLPHAFVAAHITALDPIGKQEPDGGEQPTSVPPETKGEG
jgi:hypothetical protein